MSLAVLFSRAHYGLSAPLVRVEIHLSGGKSHFSIVGLPETVVKESRERVRSSLLHSQFRFPNQKITVNLSPADLPKEGGRFDLAIALGILVASRQLSSKLLEDYEFLGELSLDGALQPVPGVLACALNCMQESQRAFIIPEQNAIEASYAENLSIYPAQHLLQVYAHLQEQNSLTLFRYSSTASETHVGTHAEIHHIVGQMHGKRALEIAASGEHHLLMEGPPGVGKTLLANCLPALLPPLSKTQALEVLAIYQLRYRQIHRLMDSWTKPPFRSPHHSTSHIALVGGGKPPQPGEISLAHRGILFLDELPEFHRQALESLREPLETGKVNIARANHHLELPARFQLVAAMNPCPCGYYGDSSGRCQCSSQKIQRYSQKISGPLRDRIDLWVRLNSLPSGLILKNLQERQETHSVVQQRVLIARERQTQRQGFLNAQLQGPILLEHAYLHSNAEQLLEQAERRWHLSPRSLHRIIRISRTIADLADRPEVEEIHMAEALSFRMPAVKNLGIEP